MNVPDRDSALGELCTVLRDGDIKVEAEPVRCRDAVKLTGVIARSTSSSTFETGGDTKCAGWLWVNSLELLACRNRSRLAAMERDRGAPSAEPSGDCSGWARLPLLAACGELYGRSLIVNVSIGSSSRGLGRAGVISGRVSDLPNACKVHSMSHQSLRASISDNAK